MTRTSKHRYVIRDASGGRIYTAYVTNPENGLRGAELEGFHAPYAQLQGIDFSECVMYWASLEGANLSFCLFRGTNLRGATLDRAVLRHADLTDADLGSDAFDRGASLKGADLSDAILTGAKVAGCFYDSETKFPIEFSPVDAEMIRVD